MKTVVIDGTEYIERQTVDGCQRYIICVDSRGLTFVGDVDLGCDDEFLTISNARCIIHWGTTRHIAELVNGPLEKTKLGATEDVIVRRDNIVFAYRAGKSWRDE
jgi:hypothetical protein